MTTEDLEKAAAEVINGGRRLTPAERDQMMYEALNRKDAEEERLRKELMGKPIYLPKYDNPLTAEEPRKYNQERRALRHAMVDTDGEYVKIPYSVACKILKDLDALNDIRLTIQKL